jgi:hypothetical protein
MVFAPWRRLSRLRRSYKNPEPRKADVPCDRQARGDRRLLSHRHAWSTLNRP